MRVTRSMTRAGVASLSTPLERSVSMAPTNESKLGHETVSEKVSLTITISSSAIPNGQQPPTSSNSHKPASPLSAAPPPPPPPSSNHFPWNNQHARDRDRGEGFGCSYDRGYESTTRLPDDILAKNRVLILQLEQSGAVAPGILKIEASGELRADLGVKPDHGTMVGLFPAMAPAADIDRQIPSWLRDYLVEELNMRGHGPPAACRVLYEGLKMVQDDVGINPSVWITETQLACAAISIQHSIEVVRDFISSPIVVEEDYEMELGLVIRTVTGLFGGGGDELPRDIQLLFELGSSSATLVGAMKEPLERLVISPFSQLNEKIEVVAKALRRDLERAEQGSHASSSDSGVGPEDL